MDPVSHKNWFTLYHINDKHSYTDSGFMKPTKFTTITHYTQYPCSIFPKDIALGKDKGTTTIDCPGCGKPVQVTTTDNTFVKLQRDVLSADKELRRTVLAVLVRRSVKFSVMVLAFTSAAFFLIFLIGNVVNEMLPTLGEAFEFLAILLAFVAIFSIINVAYSISAAVKIRRGIIMALDPAPASLIERIVAKSSQPLHRVVIQMDLKNAYDHKLSYSDQIFSKGASNLSWRVGGKIFGEVDHCYIDSNFNDSVREAE